jgi:hypothetical protein
MLRFFYVNFLFCRFASLLLIYQIIFIRMRQFKILLLGLDQNLTKWRCTHDEYMLFQLTSTPPG